MSGNLSRTTQLSRHPSRQRVFAPKAPQDRLAAIDALPGALLRRAFSGEL
jgi:hypothetical protein